MLEPGLVAYAYNLSTWKVKAKDWGSKSPSAT